MSLRALLLIGLACASANAATHTNTLVLTPSTQTGFFKTGHDVGAMNPHAYRPNEFVTNDFVFEGLVSWDPSSAGADGIKGTPDDFVVGALAESWTPMAKTAPYEITFTLRSGVTFHDGEPWNAAAAKLNFDHIMGPLPDRKHAGFHDWYGTPAAIQSWETIGDMKFKLTFKNYYEAALRELTLIRPIRFSSPKALPSLEQNELSCGEWKKGKPREWGKFTCRGVKAPIGTGPYQVVEKVLKRPLGSRRLPATDFNASCYDQNTCSYGESEYVAEVVFKRVEGHRSMPKYDTVIVRAYPSHAAMKAALLNGTLDMAYGSHALPPHMFVSLATKEDSSLVAHQADFNLNTRLIVLNSAGVLSTPALRKMVMRLIDRASLFEGELAEEEPMETQFGSTTPYCKFVDSLLRISQLANSDKSAKPSDIKQPLRFIYLKDVAHQNIIAAKVIADLYTHGIQVQPLPMNKSAYNSAMNSWLGSESDATKVDPTTGLAPDGSISFDLAYSETWGPPYDATSKLMDMTYRWGSAEADSVATSKLSSMTKKDFNEKVLKLSTIVDDNERQELYTELVTTLHNEAIFLPLTAKRNVAVTNSRVSGFKFGATEFDIPIASLHASSAKPKATAAELERLKAEADKAKASAADSVKKYDEMLKRYEETKSQLEEQTKTASSATWIGGPSSLLILLTVVCFFFRL